MSDLILLQHHVLLLTLCLLWMFVHFRNKLKFMSFLRKRCNVNPARGPFHFRAPSKILWKTVRGEYWLNFVDGRKKSRLSIVLKCGGQSGQYQRKSNLCPVENCLKTTFISTYDYLKTGSPFKKAIIIELIVFSITTIYFNLMPFPTFPSIYRTIKKTISWLLTTFTYIIWCVMITNFVWSYHSHNNPQNHNFQVSTSHIITFQAWSPTRPSAGRMPWGGCVPTTAARLRSTRAVAWSSPPPSAFSAWSPDARWDCWSFCFINLVIIVRCQNIALNPKKHYKLEVLTLLYIFHL